MFSISLEQKPIFENQDLICITNNIIGYTYEILILKNGFLFWTDGKLVIPIIIGIETDFKLSISL